MNLVKSNPDLLSGALIILFMVALFGLSTVNFGGSAWREFHRIQALTERGVAATATIVECDARPVNSRAEYVAYYEYTARDPVTNLERSYRGSDGFRLDNCAVGRTVPVLYLPDAPEQSQARETMSMMWPALSGLCGLVSLGVLLYALGGLVRLLRQYFRSPEGATPAN